MTDHHPQCLRCQNAMQRGFMLDRVSNLSSSRAHWVEGAPSRGWISGIFLSANLGSEVTTWRCRACGHLESFAA